MTAAEIFVIAAINALVTIVVAATVRHALARAVQQTKATKEELQRLRVMYGNVDHRLTDAVKKSAVIEYILTRAIQPRLRATEKALNLNQDGTQS
jgi:hypothetical protein